MKGKQTSGGGKKIPEREMSKQAPEWEKKKTPEGGKQAPEREMYYQSTPEREKKAPEKESKQIPEREKNAPERETKQTPKRETKQTPDNPMTKAVASLPPPPRRPPPPEPRHCSGKILNLETRRPRSNAVIVKLEGKVTNNTVDDEQDEDAMV